MTPPARSSRYVHTISQAAEALQQERPAEARRLLERALGLEPDEPKGLNLLGLAYFKLGLLGGAKRVYDRLVERFPREAALHVNLGLVLLRQGRLTEAEQSLRRAIELDADHQRAHCYLGLVLFRRGDLQLARQHFVRGNAHDFAKKVERRLDRLSGPRPSQIEQLQSVGHKGLERLQREPVPFRSLEPNDDPVVRDEEAWEARVGHHQQIPVPELVEEDRTASSFAQATGSRELEEARAADADLARDGAPPWPEVEFDPRGQARDRLSPREVEALCSGIGRPGFVAGPAARAKLTLQEGGWIRPDSLVCVLGEQPSALWTGTEVRGLRPVHGPRVLLLSVSGVAVALRSLQDVAVDRSRLVGFEGRFQRVPGNAWGRPAEVLRGDGSALVETAEPPLFVPLDAGQTLAVRRPGLIAWSLGLDVVREPSEDPHPLLHVSGPGWLLVAEAHA